MFIIRQGVSLLGSYMKFGKQLFWGRGDAFSPLYMVRWALFVTLLIDVWIFRHFMELPSIFYMGALFLLFIMWLFLYGEKKVTIFYYVIGVFALGIFVFLRGEALVDEYNALFRDWGEGLAVATGRVNSYPKEGANHLEDEFILSVYSVRYEDGISYPKQVQILVHVPKAADIIYGDEVTVKGRIKPYSSLRPYRMQNAALLRVEHQLTGVMHRGEIVRQELPTKWYYQRWIGICKKFLIQSVSNHTPKAGREILLSLLFGRSSTMSEAHREVWVRTGLVHLLTISGTHISLVMGSLYCILNMFSLSNFYKTFFAIVGTFFYVCLVGVSIPVLRAFGMGIFTMYGVLYDRNKEAIHGLFLIMLVFLWYNPLLIGDISFWLSNGASFGILVFYRYGYQRWTWIQPKLLRSLVSLTISAQICIWPIQIFYFGEISIVSIFTNVLLDPILEMELIALLYTLLLYAVLYGVWHTWQASFLLSWGSTLFQSALCILAAIASLVWRCMVWISSKAWITWVSPRWTLWENAIYFLWVLLLYCIYEYWCSWRTSLKIFALFSGAVWGSSLFIPTPYPRIALFSQIGERGVLYQVEAHRGYYLYEEMQSYKKASQKREHRMEDICKRRRELWLRKYMLLKDVKCIPASSMRQSRNKALEDDGIHICPLKSSKTISFWIEKGNTIFLVNNGQIEEKSLKFKKKAANFYWCTWHNTLPKKEKMWQAVYYMPPLFTKLRLDHECENMYYVGEDRIEAIDL